MRSVLVLLVAVGGCLPLVGGGPTVAYQFGRGPRFGLEAAATSACDVDCRHDDVVVRGLARVSGGVTLGPSSTGTWAPRATLAWTPGFAVDPSFVYAGPLIGGAYDRDGLVPLVGAWGGVQDPVGGGVGYTHEGWYSLWVGVFAGWRWMPGGHEVFLQAFGMEAPSAWYSGGS